MNGSLASGYGPAVRHATNGLNCCGCDCFPTAHHFDSQLIFRGRQSTKMKGSALSKISKVWSDLVARPMHLDSIRVARAVRRPSSGIGSAD